MRFWLLALVLVVTSALSTAAHAQGVCVDIKSRAAINTVKIDSAPQGAAIYINDKSCQPIGTTPWTGKLPKGDYTIIIEATGYDSASRPFKVINTRSQNQELFVPLVKKAEPPKIDVRADADQNVAGATIWLDGQAIGQAPQVVTTTKGRHQLELQKDGFEHADGVGRRHRQPDVHVRADAQGDRQAEIRLGRRRRRRRGLPRSTSTATRTPTTRRP